LSTNNQQLTRKEIRNKALLRYKKDRQRNLLAKSGKHKFILVLDNLKAGFNVAKLFRSAEAFGACEVHLINIGFFDPAPAKGSFRKVPARFHETFEACHENLRQRGYEFFALDPEAEATLPRTSFPARSAFILGHEEVGLSIALEDYPEIRKIRIPQFGQVQSLNVSIAGSIVMYEYIRQSAG